MMATARRLSGVYRWTFGTLMTIYCYFLASLSVDHTYDRNTKESVEHHLQNFKQYPTKNKKVYGLPTSTLHHDSVQKERAGITGITGSTGITGNGNTSMVFVSQNIPPSKRRKLQEKIDEIFVTTGQPYDGNLWEISDYMPQWMKGKMRRK